MSLSEAAELFVGSFGRKVLQLKPLPGERDQNFLVNAADERRFVFKISHPDEPPELLQAQQAALEQLAHLAFVPRLLPRKDGSPTGNTTWEGRTCWVRAVTYCSGTPLAEIRQPSTYLLADLGAKLAEVDIALQGFDRPILHRDFDWNLLNAPRVVSQNASLILDEATKRCVDGLAERIERTIEDLGPQLRQATIHNDANDYNVIVSSDRDAHGERLISGIIDFGDMAWTYAVAELAVVLAYLVCRCQDPLDAACEVIAAYHRRHPLDEVEVACLFDLILLRLCLSVCMSAKQQLQRPQDEYLSISQRPIQDVLPLLTSYQPRFVEAKFRAACGMRPSPKAVRVGDWIQHAKDDFHPVMGTKLDGSNSDILDFSVASSPSHLFLGLEDRPLPTEGEPMAQPHFSHNDPAQPTHFTIGRYDEPRLIYSSPQFANSPEASELDERRTIHLGIDIGAPVGYPVIAPIDGWVVVSEFRSQDQDYGGVIVLGHETNTGEVFYSLYGHLSRDSVASAVVGDRLSSGDTIGRLGNSAENGGWSPHLHFQLIIDLLDLGGSFPGVGLARERDVWTAFSPDPCAVAGIAESLTPRCRGPRSEDTMQARRSSIGPSLSVAYRRPLHVVRGSMQYLFDFEGRRYLDAYNNVPHVGHCHPRVVAAAQRQMATLNANTRYLRDSLNEYARRISKTLPDPLEVCYFLNSASEANELALRLARQVTGRQGIVVQEAAYHGHTSTLIDISPYKHDGPGGRGAPPWVHKVPLPDNYRGRFRGDQCAKQISAEAARIIEHAAKGKFPPGAFIAETLPSVGGQIIPPPDYLLPVYDAIHGVGGLAIADEVQTGFGRIGTHFWAFERYGVIPDIVVMGKPMGNGHPIAAVVTTRAIAEAFDNGMEFFSTFGGNTVSCAIGQAVLDVIAEERLQQRALQTGAQLEAGFRQLAEDFSLVGNVRGLGLFWGIELVRDRVTLEPADVEAKLIANRLREAGILIGTDGYLHNVLKVRPPMPFNEANAETLIAALRDVLQTEFTT